MMTRETLEARKASLEAEIAQNDRDRDLLVAKRNMLAGALLEITGILNGDLDEPA